MFDGGDLAILCKHISSRDQERDDFWQAMTQRFVNLQADLNLRDFMTICNAFKVAHNLSDSAFVKHAEAKLYQN